MYVVKCVKHKFLYVALEIFVVYIITCLLVIHINDILIYYILNYILHTTHLKKQTKKQQKKHILKTAFRGEFRMI